ncbi:MAG: hypothetical protein RL701_7524 [Pseudomonadota bacterium]
MSGYETSASDLLDRVEAASAQPLRAMIEISDRCNEVCVHCYQVQGLKGEISTDHWRQALDELAELGVLVLTISGGEATLRSDFLEIVEHARQRNFVVRLYTNGLRITPELAAALARLSVFEVEISVYSTGPDVHDFVTGVPGSFERTLQSIRYLREAGVPVTIKTVIMSVNQAQIEGYPAFAASLGVAHHLDPDGLMPREGFDRAPEAFNPDPALIERLQKLQAASMPAGPSPLERPEPIHAGTMLCGAARELHIEPNGEYRPCTMLDVNFGRVGEAKAREVFNSPAARAMRDLRWSHVHGCRDCDFAVACGRCHAAALAETGDALGPYPSACAAARRALSRQSELKIIAANGRSAELGPYRWLAPGVYETIEDVATPEDRERAEGLGWVRRSQGGNAAPELAVRPGELIQIRRPVRTGQAGQTGPAGQRPASSRLTRVPGAP